MEAKEKNKFFCRKCISLGGHWLLKRGLFCKKQSDLSSRSLLTFSKILPITITPRLRRQILSRAVSENNRKPKSLDGFLPVTLLLRNTINFQLSCVRDVTSLIWHFAGESPAVGVVDWFDAQHAGARAQLGGRDADIRGQVLALHTPADLERRVAVVYGAKYLGSFALVYSFTAKWKWNYTGKSWKVNSLFTWNITKSDYMKYSRQKMSTLN